MEEEQLQTQPKVERLGRSGIESELERGIMASLDKYAKKGFTREEAVGFLNQVAEYYAVTNGLGIDGARKVVSLDEIFGHKASALQLGVCPSSENEKFGGKVGVSELFLKGLSARFARVKSLPTAGVIVVCHESTHAKQQAMQATAAKDPSALSAEDREFLSDSALNPHFARASQGMKWADLKNVITTLSTLSGKKQDITPFQLRNGIYFGSAKEIDARTTGIAACQELYANLLSNPDIENYPEVKKWLGKQGGMIRLHENTEKFLGKHVLSKYREFMSNCSVPDEKLIEFATEQEKTWLDVDEGSELAPKQEAELASKYRVYDTVIKIALNGKSSEQLEEIYSKLDEEKTPFLRELLTKALSKQSTAAKETEPPEDGNN